MASAEDSQRASGSSAGRSSGSSRRQNPQQQLSTIEKSVTHLLVATKQLLETLTMWSRGSAAESEVSDVYVRLGYEFNIACRAFNAIGVDTSDLGPVPDLLRAILEDTLSQEANQASLDKYLPRIRDIIINLLHGLKKKQQRLRQRNGKEGGEARPPRQSSTASNASLESNLTQQLEDVPSRASSHRSFAQRQGSGELGGPDLPPRTTSVPGRTSPRRQNLSPQSSMHQAQLPGRETSDSTLSSNTMQTMPVIAPYPENDTMPTNQGYEQREHSSPEPTPPPPPPKQNDALQALQRGGELERRASRRFSAYQIQKHLGTSVNGIGTIPPAQHSPVPNRGRDARESMNAVRSRRSVLQHNRTKSRTEREGYEPSPSRLQHEVRRISETSENEPPHPPFADKDELESPVAKTPEDKLGRAYPFPEQNKEEQREGISATVNGPVDDHFAPPETEPQELPAAPATPVAESRKSTIARRTSSRVSHAPQRTPPQSQFIPESSPQPGKELTLFLQYKSKIKKFVLPDGADLSVPRLQLAFIEKFAWNTHNNGVDLPEIYIQDPVSGVRHEVEDLSDIKDRSVLVLNVEQLDEVKKHIDDGIGGLRRMIEGMKTSVEDQQSALQRVSERQEASAKEIASLAAAPPPAPAPASVASSTAPSSAPSRAVSIEDKNGQLSEVQSLRRDLAVVRQTYTTFVDDIKANMATIRSKAASIGPAATKAALPDLDSGSGRAYVNEGKKTLSDDSEKIVNRVDDLQDIVEDLRKDVVTRGVRPIPRQLETVSKDISTATADLKKLKEYLKREKPVWTKIWEKELQVVCDDRDLLTMQEELAADLEDDLEKAAATFALVEEATKQQNLANPRTGDEGPAAVKTVRSASRTLRPYAEDQGADPQKAKDGVLGEVRALQPNHESRLEAIERAERARQRELESRRGGEFQKELGKFVEEGKLKKSGGVEEVERMRLVKEERARKENYERVAQRERDRMEREASAAAAAAAAAAPPPVDGTAEGDADAAETEASAEPAAASDETNGALEVPDAANAPDGATSSPESGFVDAKEDAGSTPPSGESGAGA